jgi:hypothetical protein
VPDAVRDAGGGLAAETGVPLFEAETGFFAMMTEVSDEIREHL